MADTTYIVNQDSPEDIIGFEQYSQKDKNLISSFEINNLFDRTRHYIELHILTLSDEIIESDYNYTRQRQLGNAQSAGKSGASILTIEPVEDVKHYGYPTGGVKLLYHFLDDLYTDNRETIKFFIQDISPDRTEILVKSISLPEEDLIKLTNQVKSKIESQSYFSDFRVNLQNNDLFIGVNIDTLTVNGQTLLAIKLYEPLPEVYGIKDELNIVEIISDSIAYEVDSEVEIEEERFPTLRPANFDIEVADEAITPSQYYTHDELLSHPSQNSGNQILSEINKKGIDISIDHSNYANFIHFSSAEERLLNFKYKLDLLFSYEQNLAALVNTITGEQGVTGSRKYYEGLIEGILNNFDHYERFLYYEKNDYAWPKSNNMRPYVNHQSTDAAAITWFTNQRSEAIRFDRTNPNALTLTIPTYLREDSNNENYLTFIYMIGQHFDNLWLYSKAVTDKYNSDNRLAVGISKDLVQDALKNFGVKLYSSNRSIQNLFKSIIGSQFEEQGEIVNTYISAKEADTNATIQPTGYDNYQKEIYKRIYHNLPFLLKSKGTQRGLRALINCFGIPSDILQIKQYGGSDRRGTRILGDRRETVSQESRVRTNNTGSLVEGNTLSQFTSIITDIDNFSTDLHRIEVGFSPTTSINNLLSTGTVPSPAFPQGTGIGPLFKIDEYIGDPRQLTEDRYQDLVTFAKSRLGQLTRYNLKDYIRLIKFFDNIIFRMIKDFIPARVVADTGIIIKPHILERSKVKSVRVEVEEKIHTGSIDTAFIESTHGDTFGSTSHYTASYVETVQTPTGLAPKSYHNQEEAKYDGELSGSKIEVTDGELTSQNTLLTLGNTLRAFTASYWDNTDNICLLQNSPTTIYVNHQDTYQASNFFSTGINSFTNYTASRIDIAQGERYPTLPGTFPTGSFPNYPQYSRYTLKAVHSNVSNCTGSVEIVVGTCGLTRIGGTNQVVRNDITYDIRTWFNIPNYHTAVNIKYYVNGVEETTPAAVNFPGEVGTDYLVEVRDIALGNTCSTSITVQVGACTLQVKTPLSLQPSPISGSNQAVHYKRPSGELTQEEVDENIKRGVHSYFTGVVLSSNPLGSGGTTYTAKFESTDPGKPFTTFDLDIDWVFESPYYYPRAVMPYAPGYSQEEPTQNIPYRLTIIGTNEGQVNCSQAVVFNNNFTPFLSQGL